MAGEPEILARIESDAGIDEPAAAFWLKTVVAAIVELIKTGEAVEVPGLGAFGPARESVIEPRVQPGLEAPGLAGGAPTAGAPGAMVEERQINFVPDENLLTVSKEPAT